jgi:hypothetical protein
VLSNCNPNLVWANGARTSIAKEGKVHVELVKGVHTRMCAYVHLAVCAVAPVYLPYGGCLGFTSESIRPMPAASATTLALLGLADSIITV